MASFVPDPELEERRALLQAAARGSVPAQLRLEEEYHVRVYSAAERKKHAGSIRLGNMSSAVRRKIDRVIEKTGSTRDN